MPNLRVPVASGLSRYTRSSVLRCCYLFTALFHHAAGSLRRTAASPVVLCYHAVSARQRARFSHQVQLLTRRRGATHVTFDDAFACLLTNGLPALRDGGIVPTVFVVTDNLGCYPRWSMPPGHPDAAEPVMTSAELRRAFVAGLCRVGSHTCTHPRLTQISDAQLDDELQRSRADLEQLLGTSVTDLAFPYGDYDDRVVAAARRAGYTRMFTLDERLVTESDLKTGLIGRFLMSPDAWPLEFRLTCAGAYAWLYPWRRLLRRLRGREPRSTAAELVGA